jgi:redox-sensing transcriptional repressor
MKNETSQSVNLSLQAIRRMPVYMQYLRELQRDGEKTISAPAAAKSLSLNEVQVRKDFAAAVVSKGKNKVGFSVDELILGMENILGCNNINDAVLVGVGHLGKALLNYKGFQNYGLHIVAAFDTNPAQVHTEINRIKLLPTEKLSEMCRRLRIRIGIITVPADSAQVVCDQLVAGGVLAIWNFAPVHLSVPEDILLQNENMAASLALLSKHLMERLNA